MLTFSLIRESWICCVRMDGQVRSVGLTEALASAHEISELADESPLVVASLHRLLLAILHRNFGPPDTETWGALWRHGCFPADILEPYWKRWESHFDLFHDTHPFYQSSAITENDEPRTTGILEFHRSSGNNATLADHTTDERSPMMTSAEAARALVAHQTFALGGTVGYLKSCEKDADKRGSDAPSARGAVCLLQGANLFETLMLNLAEYDPGDHPKDLPCWERSLTQKRGESTPDGRVDLFTWQSRRARLFDSQASDGSTQVDQVVLVPGLRVPSTWEPFRDESLLNFYYHRQAKVGTPGWSQFRITTDRAVWRNSGAILHGLEEKTKNWQPTIVSEWIARLVEDEKLAENFQSRSPWLRHAGRSEGSDVASRAIAHFCRALARSVVPRTPA